LSLKTAAGSIHKRLVFDAVSELPYGDWNKVQNGRNIYLSLPYLSALEQGMGGGLNFFFSISYNAQDEPVLIAVFVSVKFVDKRKRFGDSVFKLRFPFKKKLENILSINALACGNVFSAGENGMLWAEELQSQDAFEEAERVHQILMTEHDANKEVSLRVFKDFWPQTVPSANRLIEKGFFDFKIDVNMVLKIHKDWKTINDYLMSMKTKFRTRANSVYRKSEPLTVKALNAQDILEESEHIMRLFDNVLEKSDFHIGTMNPETFAACKEHLRDDFIFIAYYMDDKMLGFSTAFRNANSLDANYVGLDYGYNESYAVYQRILYDYVELALQTKSVELQFGRTSETIKSAVGAVPVDMTIYIQHKRSLSNVILKKVIQSVAPSPFELRQPFKANFK
jgi:hypothetical protein